MNEEFKEIIDEIDSTKYKKGEYDLIVKSLYYILETADDVIKKEVIRSIMRSATVTVIQKTK